MRKNIIKKRVDDNGNKMKNLFIFFALKRSIRVDDLITEIKKVFNPYKTDFFRHYLSILLIYKYIFNSKFKY